MDNYVTKIKAYLDSNSNVIGSILELYKECKVIQLEPTHIIFGKKAWEIASQDKKFLYYFNKIDDFNIKKTGFVGYFVGIPVLARIEDYDWTIEEDAILFNIGSKLLGEL